MKFSEKLVENSYLLSRKEKCDYIITNDKIFASADVLVLGSVEVLKVLNNK